MRISYRFAKNLSRPIIGLDHVFSGCRALIDTGALFPVWTASEESFIALGALRDKALPTGYVGGLSGESEGSIYRYTLNMNGIYYINMPFIAIQMKRNKFHMILPATMFFGMDVDVDFAEHQLVIETNSNQVSYNMHHRKDDDGTLTIYAQ